MKRALIIFIKNPEKGKVKTRLSKSVGEEHALAIYQELLAHTRKVTQDLICRKFLYYSDFIEQKDQWEEDIYEKFLQEQDADLGQKMESAFKNVFDKGIEQVVIIGSDCPELTQEIIEESFSQLERHDVVIGPANDGGYYLLGMNTLHTELFKNKKWGTDSVLEDTIDTLKRKKRSFSLLTKLIDVDNWNDLQATNSKIGEMFSKGKVMTN